MVEECRSAIAGASIRKQKMGYINHPKLEVNGIFFSALPLLVESLNIAISLLNRALKNDPLDDLGWFAYQTW